MSVITAFAAGLLSFLSPCILPLISSYMVFISGSNVNSQYSESNDKALFSMYKLNLVGSTAAFVLGFTCVFVLLSVLFYGFFMAMGGVNKTINSIAGIIIVVLGSNIIFNFIPFLKYEHNSACETCTPKHSVLGSGEKSILHPLKRPRGLLGAFIVGLAFGAGWTPCVGAFLGSILMMAGQSGKMALAVIHLVFYSIGLGLPFIIASFFWGTVLEYIRKLNPLLPFIRIVSGLFLMFVGILMINQRFFLINSFFLKMGFAVSKWAQKDSVAVYVIPALIFIVIALFPIVCKMINRKKIFTPAVIVFSSIFVFFAIANMTKIINCALIFSKWLLYAGI
ncbi:MAG: cytochrome c biogenesis protein CcdA [Treponema sp.]|jgi:cytochrome c-type biogenesis protein|nr:cytochrome c biogenesis protein CcdA [Treponema sp.]